MNRHRMLVIAWAALASGACQAAEVPKTYWGHWVPQGQSCDGPLSLDLSAQGIVLRGSGPALKRPVDVCHACAGPDSAIVWIAPSDVTDFDFIAYAQGEGKARSIKLEPLSRPLQSSFPAAARQFRSCGKR